MNSRKAIFLHPPHVGRHFICAEWKYTFCGFLNSIPTVVLQALNRSEKFMRCMEKRVEKLFNVLPCSYERTKVYSNHRIIGGDNINQGLLRTGSQIADFIQKPLACPGLIEYCVLGPHRCLVNELIEIHDAPPGITI